MSKPWWRSCCWWLKSYTWMDNKQNHIKPPKSCDKRTNHQPQLVLSRLDRLQQRSSILHSSRVAKFSIRTSRTSPTEFEKPGGGKRIKGGIGHVIGFLADDLVKFSKKLCVCVYTYTLYLCKFQYFHADLTALCRTWSRFRIWIGHHQDSISGYAFNVWARCYSKRQTARRLHQATNRITQEFVLEMCHISSTTFLHTNIICIYLYNNSSIAFIKVC